MLGLELGLGLGLQESGLEVLVRVLVRVLALMLVYLSYLCRVVKQLIFAFSRRSVFHNFLKFFICAFLRDEEMLIYVFRDNVLFSLFPVRTKKYLSLSAFLETSGDIMSEKHVVIKLTLNNLLQVFYILQDFLHISYLLSYFPGTP